MLPSRICAQLRSEMVLIVFIEMPILRNFCNRTKFCIGVFLVLQILSSVIAEMTFMSIFGHNDHVGRPIEF